MILRRCVILGFLLLGCRAGLIAGEVDEIDLELRVEVFSLSLREAGLMKRGAGRYVEMLEQVKKGKAKLEKLMMVSTGDGTEVQNQQIRVFSYPAEYEGARWGVIPKNLPAGFTNFEKFVKPATVSGYDTRYLGDQLEASLLTELEGSGYTRVELRFDHMTFQEMKEYGEGNSAVKVPSFNHITIRSQLLVKAGSTVHFGTVPAPGGVHGKVWMAFVTVESIKSENDE